jgi:hypothetical protein
LLRHVVWQKFTDFSEMFAALVMEAASTSETSVSVCHITQHNNPEGLYLHTGCRENLKSHMRKSDKGMMISANFGSLAT